MSLQIEAAEALCSALYQMPFAEFLGETEEDFAGAGDDWTAWFHLGEKPKNMRVSIIRPKSRDEVLVKLEWRNYWADARNPLRAEQTLHVSTYATSEPILKPALEDAIRRILHVFKDVLEETGVAGDISLLQQHEEQPETVEDMLDAMVDAAREQRGTE